jgi:carbon monoxide dehydrogenase subunit G
MKLEQSFEVDAPLERVWQTLIDVEHVAPCLPGAAVTGRNDDGSYNGTFTVKIGPTTASYTGRLEMENIDEASHTATMQAQGTDKRGQGGAKATIHSRLAPANGRGTRVEVVTDYHITGRLARFGRGGMIEDISERLLREFAKRLQTSLVSQPDTVVSGVPEPAAPETVGEPEAPMQGETVFGQTPSETTPPEAPVSPAGEVSPPPPPPSEPIAPPQPWGTPSEPSEPAAAVPEPTDPASGPSPAEPAEPPSPVAEPVEAAAGAPPEPPAPPPPPSPGPPPVATPPPASSTAGERPPLQHLPEPSEPMQGLSLVGGVVWNRVKRNPAPAAAVGVAVVLLLARRRRRRR